MTSGSDRKIVHTARSVKDLRRRFLEQMSEWDREELIAGLALEAISGDQFVDSVCTRCRFRKALFNYEYKYVRFCPSCTAERIETIVSSGRPIPVSLEYLHYEAQTEVAAQTRRRTDNVVRLVRCHRCGKLLRCRECRYWLPEGATSSPAYCVECLGELRAESEVE